MSGQKQSAKGFHPWSAARKASQGANAPKAQRRRQARAAAQEAAHKANVAAGTSPWLDAKDARLDRRAKARARRAA